MLDSVLDFEKDDRKIIFPGRSAHPVVFAGMKTSFLVLIICAASFTSGAIDVDTENRKEANAVCIKDSDAETLELRFYVDFGGNPVDKVLALEDDIFIRNDDGSTNEAACTMTNNTGDSMEFNSRVSLSGTNDNNRCGARRIGNTNNFLWVVEVRALYNLQVYVGIDRRYFVQCIYDSALDNFAVAQISVFGEDLRGSSSKLSPVNTMSLLRQTTRNGPFSPSSVVQLEQSVKLRIASEVTSLESNLDPYGVYSFSCDFGPFNKADRTVFILGSGCPNETNAFGLTNGFRYAGIEPSTSVNKRLFTTETDSFVMISDYPPNNFYYFSCYVGYCFGSLGTDNRCTDFCGFNSARRKRQVEQAEYDRITIAIKIDEASPDNTLDTEGQTEESSSQVTVIVVSSVMSLVFLIVVAVLTIMLCRGQGHCHDNQEDQLFDNSSRSSVASSKHEPMTFYPPTIIQPQPKA